MVIFLISSSDSGSNGCRFDDNIIEGEAVPDHIQKIVAHNYDDDSESVHDLAFSCTNGLLDNYAGDV